MLFTLGLDDQFVGVSHECDFPPQAKQKTFGHQTRAGLKA